jgi:hypothetical protein
MSNRLKFAVALAALAAFTSATAVNATNPTSLCGKVWNPKPHCQ